MTPYTSRTCRCPWKSCCRKVELATHGHRIAQINRVEYRDSFSESVVHLCSSVAAQSAALARAEAASVVTERIWSEADGPCRLRGCEQIR
jgi:hypothetical protein